MKTEIMIAPLLCLLSGACTSSAEPPKPAMQRPAERPDDSGGDDPTHPTYGHLTTSDRVKDAVGHEAFAGFGRFILPAERMYDDDSPLANVASMLPYHCLLYTSPSPRDA